MDTAFAGTRPPPRRPFYYHLYVQVLGAIVLGGLFGWLFPALATNEVVKALGDGFIKLIKMMIAPIIFCTIVSGIAGMRDGHTVGRVGGKALLYFEVVSTFALAIGMVVANVLRPGAGFPNAAANADKVAAYVEKAHAQSTVDFVLNIIPDTAIGAFARGDILQVLLFAVLFGFALAAAGDRGRPIREFIDEAVHVVFGVIAIIMRAAPLGAFGAMAYTIGKNGPGSIGNLLQLIGTFYLTAALFVVIVLGTIGRIAGFSIFRFLAYIKEELLIVLSTSSSESALPSLMLKLEGMGCPKAIVGLVVPLGYSFNLDGTNIYMTLAALFVAQAMGVDLTFGEQLTILGVAMLTSKGASGVTGAGFITLAATLAVVPKVPLAGLALIFGIDKFMSECRALTNIIGNGVATVVVSAWEGRLDRIEMRRALSGQTFVDEMKLDAD